MKKILYLILSCLLLVGALCSCDNKDKEHEQKVLQYRLNKFAIYEEENEKYNDYEVDVAFLGDSLTDLYNVKDHYPQYLVSNRGIGGDKTFDLENRLQLSVYDLKPKVAVMLIGANNFTTMFENYESILKGFKENLPNTKVILLSLTSMSGNWVGVNELASYNNVKIKKLAEKYSFEYVDLFAPLFDLETGAIFSEYTIDGLHLSEKGYEVLTREITPVIEKQLTLWKTENK